MHLTMPPGTERNTLVVQYKMGMRVSGSRICLYILPKSFMNEAGIGYRKVFVKNGRRFIAHSQHLGEGGTGSDLSPVCLNFSPKQTFGTGTVGNS